MRLREIVRLHKGVHYERLHVIIYGLSYTNCLREVLLLLTSLYNIYNRSVCPRHTHTRYRFISKKRSWACNEHGAGHTGSTPCSDNLID